MFCFRNRLLIIICHIFVFFLKYPDLCSSQPEFAQQYLCPYWLGKNRKHGTSWGDFYQVNKQETIKECTHSSNSNITEFQILLEGQFSELFRTLTSYTQRARNLLQYENKRKSLCALSASQMVQIITKKAERRDGINWSWESYKVTLFSLYMRNNKMPLLRFTIS